MPLFPLPDELNEYAVSFLRDHEHTLTQLAKTCRTGNTLVKELREPLCQQASDAMHAYFLGESKCTTELIAILNNAFEHNRFYILQTFLQKALPYAYEFENSKDEVTIFLKSAYDAKLKLLADAGEYQLFRKYFALPLLPNVSQYAGFNAWPALAKGLLSQKKLKDFEEILKLRGKPSPLLIECCAYYATLPPDLFHLEIALHLITLFRELYPQARLYGRNEIKKLLERIDQSSEARTQYTM